MDSRFKSTVGAGLIVAAGAGLWLAGAREGDRPSPARPAAREAAPARPAVRYARARPAPLPAETTCDAECLDEARKAAREARVVEALARLERRTAHITSEALGEEQAHLLATAQALHSRETEQPSVEEQVDENGGRWKKLAYADGAVRYALPEEP